MKEKEQIKKTSLTSSIKVQTEAAGNGFKELGSATKEGASEFLDMMMTIPKLPWKDLPLKGWLCIGVVFLVGILMTIYIFL